MKIDLGQYEEQNIEVGDLCINRESREIFLVIRHEGTRNTYMVISIKNNCFYTDTNGRPDAYESIEDMIEDYGLELLEKGRNLKVSKIDWSDYHK